MSLKRTSNSTHSRKNFNPSVGTGGLAAPVITSITICDSSYNNLDDTALDPAGSYVKLNGTGFQTGCSVYFNNQSLSATFVSSTEVRIQTPATSVGAYNLMLFNPNNNGGAIYLNLSVSNFPTWTTSAGSLGSVYETTAYANTVVASGDTPLTYSLYSGTLPSGITLSSGGVLSGTTPAESGSTTYSFVANVKDNQGQDATRSFSLTINVDVVTWNTPAQNYIISSYEYAPISNVTANATSAAGFGVLYSPNSTPSGISTNTQSGLISGTINTAGNYYTRYTATANSSGRSATRDVVFNVNQDVVTFSSPTNNQVISAYEYTAISNVTAGATSAAGFGVLYSANATPTGITLNANTGVISGTPTTVGNTYALLTATANTTSRSNTRNIIYNVNQDVVTFSNPSSNNSTISLSQGVAMTNVTLAATSAAGFGVQYSVTNLPTGVSLSGNTISGTPTGTGTTVGTVTATANTTSRTATYYINWSISIASDAYFANTVMLLSANTSYQTNSFVADNSNNNSQITVVGDTRASNMNPYQAGYYSNYFDGTGDYLSITSGVGAALGTDFTIELWYYPISMSSYRDFVTTRASVSDETGSTAVSAVYFGLNGDKLYYDSYNTQLTGSTSLVVGTWQHVACVRSGSTVTLYLNGVSQGTVADSTAKTDRPIFIGGLGSIYNLIGNISNLRILKNQALYTTNFTPPTGPLTAVANTILLTCQSNRLVDSSVTNATITKNGDTTVSPAHPFATVYQAGTQYYSTSFDGTGDYLSLASNSAFDFGTGNFTIECWVYPTSLSNSPAVIAKAAAVGSNVGWFIELASNIVYFGHGTNSGQFGTFSVTLGINTWSHIACTRSGGTLNCFVNGVSAGAASGFSTGAIDNANALLIGSGFGTSSYDFAGRISNVRIVKGTVVYTTNFTPSTTPLTAVANTSLLTCQDSTFKDNSNNAFTVTSAGDVKPVAVSPFTPSSYSNTAITTYGSGYFDGTGDYLTIADNNAFEMTGDFTVEAWFYSTAFNTYNDIVTKGASGIYQPYYIFTNSSGNLLFYSSSDGASWNVASGVSFGTTVLNTWYHVAVSRQGSSLRLFLNGSLITTITNGSALYNNTRDVAIGARSDGTETFTGYISDVRIVKGTALYTSNFVPQFTSPLTNVTNTQLLTLQTNGAHNNSTFKDESSFSNIITRSGNATNGTFSPYGDNWSVYFDGANDELTLPTAVTTSLSGTYTIECWCYQTAAPTGTTWDTSNPLLTQVSGSSIYHIWALTTTGLLLLTRNGASYQTLTSSITFPVNQWFHVAITNVGTTVKLYVNGSLAGTLTQSAGTWSTTAGSAQLGATLTYSFKGYISNFRIVNGTEVYTTTFTPPTAPLTAITNTSLLTCQSNRFVDNSLNNYSVTRVGDVSVQKFSPFSTVTVPKYYSAYFDGTGDYVTMPNNSGIQFGSGDFTIEFWMYPTKSQSDILVMNDSPLVSGNWALIMSTYLYFQNYWGSGSSVNTTSGPSLNTWSHIAVVKIAGTINIYINGVSAGSGSGTTYNGTNILGIGGANSTGVYGFFGGYISNLRIVKGLGVYTGSFTPPTSPLAVTQSSGTNISAITAGQTVLLTCQDNTFKDNSTTALTLTGFGDAKPLLVSPFTPTVSTTPVSYSSTTFGGSMYFDGTGDYLTVPNSSAFALPGDFTIECWVYMTTVQTSVFAGNINGSGYGDWAFFYNSTNGIRFLTGNGGTVITGAYTIPANAWVHVAISRSGTSVKIFANGVLLSTTTDSNTNPFAGTMQIGRANDGTLQLAGYLSDLRIVKGTALYTSNFYPGSEPLTPIAYTNNSTTIANTAHSSLLLNGTSGGIIDQTRTVNLETVGDVKVTSNTYPYSSAGQSYYFDGTGDWLYSPNTDVLSFGTGDFTVEYWMKFTGGTQRFVTGTNAAGTDTFMSYIFSGSELSVLIAGTVYNPGTSIPTNTWHHIAITRSSGTVRLFLNGTQVGTNQTLNASITNTRLTIGNGIQYTGPVSGYMSDIRITKGYARYTTNFTPTTTPHMNK